MTSWHPLGPFFAVERLDEVPDMSTGWRALGPDLTDPTFVDAWVTRAWDRISGGGPESPADRRTLGAVLHLGVLARLTSPWIARFLLGLDDAVPTLDDLWWRDDGTTMFPLAVTSPCTRAMADGSAAEPATPGRHTTGREKWHGDSAGDSCAGDSGTGGDPAKDGSPGGVDDFARRLVRCIVLPLDFSTFTPSAAIRRGNAASAINTAASLVVRQPTNDEPHRAAAHDLVTACLRLLNDGDPAASGQPLSPTFRRTSCCLAYALPGGTRAAVCGDCVLRE